MCYGCWADAGGSTDLPDNHEEIITAIKELYAMEGCDTGGPLHVELDDDNVDMPDGWVPYNGRPGDAPWHGPEVIAKAQQICDFMNPLPVPQRWAIIGKWRGHFQ